ncbi:5-oxoprolinase subunit PxpB [uncultured Methylophaga sp.]|uniref:5-oxoprolinase subunit PxpB n=1 Tax=uncultured Methylophaga sp. TaxID=285271 RepID=UPI0030F8B0B3|tara:strand:- start:168 stop:860 length:693 start_codon:yes stop_codon:yes gene_type:complete
MKLEFHIEHAGPDAVLIRFGDQINTDLVPIIRAATKRLQKEFQEEIRGLVPSYTTLMLCYDPRKNDFPSIQDKIQQHLANLNISPTEMGNLVEIPVWYDPEVGPDLQHVAEYHQISIDDVIHRHSETIYQIFAIGFAPGFAYMGNVSDQLATPRLTTPRPHVAAGSVAIADQQTAVYPISTPGGWNILGRTTMKMFDRHSPKLCPVRPGDRVKFVSVSKVEFLLAGGQIE